MPSSTASRSCCVPSGASLLAVNLLPRLLLRSRREEGGGAKCRALRSRAVMVAMCAFGFVFVAFRFLFFC